MNATQISFTIPNVTARKLIENLQALQLAPSPSTGASRHLTIEVSNKQKDSREATTVSVKLSYLGEDELSYLYEGQFVNDTVVNQFGSYVGSEHNFQRAGDGLFSEAVIVETV